MKFGESDFGDLLASAEQLTAEIDSGAGADLPRYLPIFLSIFFLS